MPSYFVIYCCAGSILRSFAIALQRACTVFSCCCWFWFLFLCAHSALNLVRIEGETSNASPQNGADHFWKRLHINRFCLCALSFFSKLWAAFQLISIAFLETNWIHRLRSEKKEVKIKTNWKTLSARDFAFAAHTVFMCFKYLWSSFMT